MTSRNNLNIGILGGGQLGRMLIQAAHDMKEGFNCIVWEPSKDACAFEVADDKIVKPYDDKEALKEFIEKVDKVVLEFENIPVEIVEKIEQAGKLVAPSSNVLSIVQDRIKEKTFFDDNGIPCAEWYVVDSKERTKEILRILDYPLVLKTARFGYDGKGQIICRGTPILGEAYNPTIAWYELDMEVCIAEKMVPFDMEISIIGARNEKGETVFYEITKNVHANHVLFSSKTPIEISEKAKEKAEQYVQKAMEALDVVGLLALEMFVVGDEVLANEMAARPHNSGHWTMDGAKTSQFEQCIRAATGMPFGSCEITHDILMINLLGDDIIKKKPQGPNEIWHDYKKGEAREGRKMGHVNHLLEEL